MGALPKRVLFVDCGPFSGGAQRSMMALVGGLRERGIVPFVASADRSAGGVVERCLETGVPVRLLRARHWRRSPLGLWQFLWDRWAAGRALRGAAAEWRPEIVHANTVRAALLVPPRMARAVPLVVHDRDLRAPRGARRVAGGKARRVVAISRVVAACWPKGCDVVPNGLPVDEIARTAACPESAGQVALVADFVPWKRHDLFLEALSRLRESRPEARALLVGRVRGADRAWFEEVGGLVVRLGLSSAVTVLTDVVCAWPHIAGCRALVSCAGDEPFGRTVVEALALGKPVVAVRGGGPEEILEGCGAGVLVPGDAEAVARALDGTWDWGGDPNVAAAARRRAEDFSTERMVERVCEVYRALHGAREAAPVPGF